MSAVPAHTGGAGPSRHDALVGEMLSTLARETERTASMLGLPDTPPLLAVLDARDAMLDALEGATQAFTRARAPHEVKTSPSIRAELIARAAALQRANVALLQRVRTECDRLAVAIAEMNRPDGVASAYAGTVADGVPHLDLVR